MISSRLMFTTALSVFELLYFVEFFALPFRLFMPLFEFEQFRVDDRV